MTNDYQSWLIQNEDIIEHLRHHETILYDRISDVFLVMQYIIQLPKEEVNSDLEVMYDIGFSYLFSRIGEIKIYLDMYFNGDFHHMLHFDELINYQLYLDDLKEVLVDQETWNDDIKHGFDQIGNQIEAILREETKPTEDVIDDFNIILLSIIPAHHEYLTVPEIFARVSEVLNVEEKLAEE
jgi:hypothetical protein